MYTIRIVRETDVLTIPCHPNEYLLTAIEKSKCGNFIIGCRGGGCGVCKIEILDGSVICEKMNIMYSSKEDQKEGIVLACRAKPATDITLRLIGI